MTITFNADEHFEFTSDVVTFSAQPPGGKRVECRISLEALVDDFGANERDPLGGFRAQREAIQAKARRFIERGQFDELGRVVISSGAPG